MLIFSNTFTKFDSIIISFCILRPVENNEINYLLYFIISFFFLSEGFNSHRNAAKKYKSNLFIV